MAKFLSLGSALEDIYLIDRDDFVAAQPQPEEPPRFSNLSLGSKVDIDRINYQVGGGGTNSAVEFARHGHEVAFVGNIAHDPAGEAVLSTLDEEGVDNRFVNFSSRQHTGTSVILLDKRSGERTVLTYRGAAHKFANFSPDILDEYRPDWLYITTLGGDLETLAIFCARAYELGIKVMLNPGLKELDNPRELLRLTRYLTFLMINKEEAAALVPGKILAELLSHLQNYLPGVIITAGSMGAIASDGESTYRLGRYEDVKVKDATGAGDAFGSGFLAHYAAGHSFRSSLIYAAANSTSVVQHLGAKQGLLTGFEKLHPMPIQKL